ncbi:uncharacterized protein N0V89_012085 [Didymosphaeria variabile]|uniref:Ankyrin n=1 Tax=Didymosphaeria variabile TaxID=1932322 RepID=A0A9W9C6C9_9PLEO|nr:uncharacterized protein N0V89_012085 [Didymosphaeria variabile]KAJ4345949.1 hypothetical protein N0V89_012085 [Didymosphaeria variabile]
MLPPQLSFHPQKISMAVLKFKDSLENVEKDEFGDWEFRLVTDAAGRTALDAARHGEPLEEVKRLVEHEMVTLKKGYYYGYTRSFTEAAKRGQIKAVQRLIEAGVDIHARAFMDMVGSALEQAALKRRTEVVKIILATEERQNAKDCYSANALEQAVQDARHDEVTRLMKAKKFLEAAQAIKDTALQDAAGLGDMEIARSLVKYGANADAATDVSHERALSSAASGGHLGMVEYLIQNGAGTTVPCGSSQCTPLRAAASGGYLEIVERLLTIGADPNADRALRAASSGGHLAVVERLLKAGALPNDPDKWNREQYSSPLQEAALGGHLDVVEILLQAGADINEPSVRQGRTALQAAAGKGNVELVERLMAAGAEVNAKAGEWGRTALQAAAEAGSIDIVNTFLNAGAKLETDAWGSASPSLMLTIKGNHAGVFERLLQEVAKEKAETTKAMRRALEACIETGHVEFLKSLLSLGMSVNQEHGSHFRLLTVAATRGYTEVVKVLLEAGVKVHDSEARSSTALQAAVEGDHLETAQVLLSDGADPSAAAGRKEPPLHMACMKGNEKMVRLLLDAGADVHAVSYTERAVLDAAEEGDNQAIINMLKRRQAETPAPRKRSMSLDVSTITKAELCATCENLPAAFFTGQCPSWEDSPKWHLSLYSLQYSSRSGCPFCMFFWKQLGITTITLPQPSEVRLYRGSSIKPVESMWSQIDEPFPEDIECPKTLRTGFQLNIESFESRSPLHDPRGSPLTFFRQATATIWKYFVPRDFRTAPFMAAAMQPKP